MKNRLISAGVLTLVSMLGTSCQKTTAEQFMDVQHEIIATLDSIQNQTDAKQQANRLSELYSRSNQLQKAMNTEQRRQMWSSEEFTNIWIRQESLKNKLCNKDYYGSQQLKNIMVTPQEYLLP